MYKLIVMLLPTLLGATTDLSALVTTRSYPSFGIQARMEAGKNFLLYGEGKKSGPLYGLLRPSIKLDTSAVINAAEASLELYPISFVGFKIGHRSIWSDFDDFDFYDCESVACKGKIKRDYASARMALAYGQLIALSEITVFNNHYDHHDANLPVAEFRYFSLAASGRDESYFSRYAFGIKMGQDVLLILREFNRFSRSQDEYAMNLLTYIKKIDKQVFTLGVGESRSSFIESGFSAVFQWKYNFKNSELLF